MPLIFQKDEVIIMLKTIMSVLVFILMIIGFGMIIEYSRFRNNSLRANANQLKRDLVDILKGFWEKPRIRHIFEPSLASEFRTIIQPYAVVGMDIDLVQSMINGIPFVGIEFVPNHPFEAEILSTLCDYVRIKFRRYLTARNLSWKTFTMYTQSPNDVQIYIFYAEFEEDRPLVQSKYQEVLREKCDADFGYLRDEDLDREIKDVNPPRV